MQSEHLNEPSGRQGQDGCQVVTEVFLDTSERDAVMPMIE
jgi:hypothetical protein